MSILPSPSTAITITLIRSSDLQPAVRGGFMRTLGEIAALPMTHRRD